MLAMISDIKEFYSGKTVFVTGATGFLGKALIEKLLRTCDGIQRIYILLRPKKSKSGEERAQEYISDPIFDFNGLNDLGLTRKLVPIFGDVSLQDLGISSEDREVLIKSVNIVFHLAAIVKLNAPLRYAVQRNLKPVESLIELCHQMERLDCLVYTSTIAVLNGTETTEELVPQNLTVTPEFVIKACEYFSDKELKKMKKFLFFEYMNTYCISKALAEQLLYKQRNRLNIAIIRPSAVLSSYSDPVPGWVHGLQGSISAGILVGLGLMKVFPSRANCAQCVIPVDYAANALIASARSVSNQKKPNLQVYNVTTKSKVSPPMRFIMKMIRKNAVKYPSKRVVRPPVLRFARNQFELQLEGYIKHWIFAYFIDFLGKLSGVKTRIVSITNHMNNNMKDIRIFMKTSPEYEISNTLALINQMTEIDRKLFNFDIRTIDWHYYCENLWLGARRHILKERDEEIERARIIFKRVAFKYHILNMVWLSILSILLYILFYTIFDFLDYDFYLPSISTIINPNSTQDLIRIVILLTSLTFGYNILGFILL